ncbi:MAG: restriction endonuclease subunit S [Mariniphaga sp.]
MDNLPKGWKNCYIEDIAYNVQYGFTGKTIEKGNVKYLRITDIQNNFVDWSQVPFVEISPKEANKYLLQNNDIVFARTGATAGKSFLINELISDSVFASYLIRIVPNLDKIFPKYLYLYFQSPDYWSHISGNVEGAAQPNFNGRKLARIPFPLPPLSEQTRIVTKLDALFARIDKSIALLEENIKHTKALMASVLEEVFGNEKESKLGEILTLKRGYDLPTQFRVKGDYALLGANGIIDYHKDYKAVGPGVCTGRSGSIGLVHYIKDNYWPLNTSLYVEDFKNNNRRYIYYLLKSASSGLIQQAAFAAVPTLDRKKAHEFIFVKYHKNAEDQKRISTYLDQVSQTETKILSTQQSKLVYLKALKSSLLDRAFKGEL